jgi:hypothetical protein
VCSSDLTNAINRKLRGVSALSEPDESERALLSYDIEVDE